MKFETDGHCFVCGKKNKQGLQLDFEIDEERKSLRTVFIAGPVFQGYDGIVHGGIISTLLDEAMAKLAFELGYNIVTASLEIRFKKAAPILQPLTVHGEIVEITKRLIKAKASIRREDGMVLAVASSTLLIQ